MQHQWWLHLHLKTTRDGTAEGRSPHCHTGVRPQTLYVGLPATFGPSLWPTILCDQIDLLYLPMELHGEFHFVHKEPYLSRVWIEPVAIWPLSATVVTLSLAFDFRYNGPV